MEALLQGINEIKGVIGGFIYGENQDILESKMPSLYEKELIAQAISYIEKAKDSFRVCSEEASIDQMVLFFEEGGVIVKNNHSLHVCVLFEKDTVLPMLQVALNVAVLKLEKVGRTPVGAGLRQSHGVSVSRSVSPSLFNIGGGSTIYGSLDPPPDALGLPKLRAITRELARCIGPVAKPVVRRFLHQMGLSPITLGYSHLPDFLKFVGSEISNPDVRSQFLEKAKSISA